MGAGRGGAAGIVLGILVVTASVTALAGCGGGAPRMEVVTRPDYREAPKAELVRRANAWTAATVRIRGEMRMWPLGGTPDGRHVDAGIIASRSGAIRVQGSRSVVGNLFDLAADGARMLLRIPSRETVYFGGAQAPGELDPERPYLSLRPYHFTEALLPQPLPSSSREGTGEVIVETYPDRYALAWLRRTAEGELRLRQRTWIGRRELRVTRRQVFRDDGRVMLDASYSAYPANEAGSYPRRIVVRLPFEGLVVRIDVDRSERDLVVPPGAFELRVPSGDRRVPIEEAVEDAREAVGTQDDEAASTEAKRWLYTARPSA